MNALGSYARLRDELCPHPKAPSFFITTTGTRLGRGFNDVFAGLVRSAGLNYCGRLPRPHDLRHRFAVRTHLLRRSCAMGPPPRRVDRAVLALWLGHEQVETTDIYAHADLSTKEKALARTRPPHIGRGRYRPPDHLLAFCQASDHYAACNDADHALRSRHQGDHRIVRSSA